MLQSDLKVWILEDDPGSRFIFEETLGVRYAVRLFGALKDLDIALDQSIEMPSLLIADLRLPDGVFLDFCVQKTNEGKQLPPFVVVSSLDDLDLLRECYRRGALDYIAKPFTKNEIIGKVERVLQFQQVGAQGGAVAQPKSTLRFSPLRLMVEDGRRRAVQLTAKEYQLLTILHDSSGFVSRETFYLQVWGNVNVSTKTLDVHIFNLRRKVEALDLCISYHSNLGFLLETKIKRLDESRHLDRPLDQ